MKEKMKAIAVTSAGNVSIVNDVPVPVPDEYEALVRIHSCGFCNGTDIQIIDGILTKEEGMGDYPTILGHEAAGEVVSLGRKVRYIKPGDRFIRPNLKPERLGGYSRTYGNMAEYGLVADWKAMLEDGFTEEELPFIGSMGQIPGDFDFVDAGVLLSLSECHSAVENFNIQSGMDVLIYGAGPMGLGMMSFIRKKTSGFLGVVDGIQSRLVHAANVVDIDKTIDYTTQNIEAVIGGRSFDVVIDCVGSTEIILQGTKQLKQGGKLCAMGVLKSNDFMIDLSRLSNNTSLHMLNFPYNRFASLNTVIKSIKSGDIKPKDYYSHVFYFEEIEKALELTRTKQVFKAVLTF